MYFVLEITGGVKFMKRGALCFALLSFCVTAGAQTPAPSPDIKAFVSEYVAAFNSKNVTRLHALYYPKSLTCITPESRDFYDGLEAIQWRDPIPANYTFRVGAVNENNLKALESFSRFPLKPAQELQIDYQVGDDSGSIILLMVRENGRLYYDAPCASDEALKRFHDEAPARAKFNAQNKALAAAIQEPLRSQLLALLRAHKTAAATDRYKEASGQDMKTSMFVIDALAHEGKQ
jgi:hypothetical protein